MTTPSTSKPDELDRLAEDAERKSPATSDQAEAIPPIWMRRERQYDLQPSMADRVGSIHEEGVHGLKKIPKHRLRPDKHGSTQNVHKTEAPLPKRLTNNVEEQPVKTKILRPVKVSVGDIVIAMHDFIARSADEMNLAKGDHVEVTETYDEFHDGWLMGRNLLSCNCGLFPESYIGVEVSETVGAGDIQPIVQKDPEGEGLDSDVDSRRDIVEAILAGKAPNPLCSSCGARRGLDGGCSGSCDGKRDSFSDQANMHIEYPKRGRTRIPAHLVSKQALIDLYHPFVEEGETIVVLQALGQQNIDDLLGLSAEYKEIEIEMDAVRSHPGNQASDKMSLPPSNGPIGSPRSSHDDDGGDGNFEMSDYSSDAGDNASSHGVEVRRTGKAVAIEEHTPPSRDIYSESQTESRSPEESSDSNASYSALFSERSHPQPTDPSSLSDFLSVDRAGSRAYTPDVPIPTKDHLDEVEAVEDCNRSISSIADSIHSAVSGENFLGQAGVNYMVAKFTQSDPELLALYTEASKILTKDRFVDNNRRLLKMFYLDFVHEQQTPSRKEAVAFLRSRRRRAEISLDIFRAVTPDNEENHLAEIDRKELSMLNAYFETLDAADAGKNVEEDQLRIDSDGSEVEDGKEPPELDMNSLQVIGEAFVTSQAFSNYKQRLHRFLHPEQDKDHGSTGSQVPESKVQDNPEEESTAVESETQPSARAVTKPLVLDDGVAGTEIQIETGKSPGKKQLRSRHSQEPVPQPIPTTDRDMPWQRESLASWAMKLVTDTLLPPSKGSQRIWYLCGCGEHSYLDVKELEHGGIESEWRGISESAAAVRRACLLSESVSPGGQLPETPSPAHLGPASPVRAFSQDLPGQATTPHTPRAFPSGTTATSSTPARNTPHDPLFLLICINGKAYKTLAELKCLRIDDSYNDELMVRGILDLYEQTRKGHQWTADLLLPTWMVPAGVIRHSKTILKYVVPPIRALSFIQDLSAAQSISRWWSKCALNVSPWAPLHIIDTADFVEFELVPHPEGKEAFPSHFTSGCWPPDTTKYLYRPVPIKCVKTMNLWHMRRPGPHTEVYWYNTAPKKKDGPLYRPSGTVDEVVGYGVRINERLNDVLILWWSLIFILATGAFVYVYSCYTSDDSSAFGLGAYLIATFAVYIQLQYAWWKRT